MTQVAWTDRFAAPLDGARRAALGVARKSSFVRATLGSRDRRLAWILAVHAGAALTLTVTAPVPLLVLVPIVLGVPHVVADVRHLVLRRDRGGPRRALLAGCAVLALVSVAGLLGAPFDVPSAEVTLGATFLVAIGVLALRERPTVLGAVLLASLASLGVLAASAPRPALVVLVHAHNVVALVVWLWLFRPRLRSVLPSLAVVGLAAGAAASGIFLPFSLRSGIWNALGTNLLAAADLIAPGVPGVLGLGLTVAFVFLQSVHYLVWLVLIPADDRPAPGATSFRNRFRELARDVGTPGVAIALTAWAVVLVSGAAAPLRTRHAYLVLASFHVWLELAVLVRHAIGEPKKVPSRSVAA